MARRKLEHPPGNELNLRAVVSNFEGTRHNVAQVRQLARAHEKRRSDGTLAPVPQPPPRAEQVVSLTERRLINARDDLLADTRSLPTVDRYDELLTRAVMFTAAFGVTEQLVGPLAEESDLLRFILMEKPPTQKQGPVLRADRDLIISFGASLGEMYVFKNGQPVARKPIAEFELEKWLLRESHFRRAGHVFFVHTKFLLVDPLSDDPLVFTGSANFSPDSLLENDENMLLIRGNTRVADIYMTEFDRLFRHFYFQRGQRGRGPGRRCRRRVPVRDTCLDQ